MPFPEMRGFSGEGWDLSGEGAFFKRFLSLQPFLLRNFRKEDTYILKKGGRLNSFFSRPPFEVIYEHRGVYSAFWPTSGGGAGTAQGFRFF